MFTLEPLTSWRAAAGPLPAVDGPPSGALRAALTCTGSLTRHLETTFNRPVRVEIIDQEQCSECEPCPPLWSSNHTLTSRMGILQRNAWLVVGGVRVLFAHTQLAIDGLRPALKKAIEEGQRPLGSLILEEEKSIERQRLELAQARFSRLARLGNLDPAKVFWCRRSLFVVNGAVYARILEVFLSDLTGV